jgi:AcrR family transcriptional regulator
VKHRPEQILDAAITLFADEGVGVPTSRIAREAGVSNGTLFNYFPTKQALLDALYAHVKGSLGRTLHTEPPDDSLRSASRTIWEAWLGWARAHPEHHRVGRLLHEAGLVSPDAVAATEVHLAPAIDVLQRMAASDEIADLPVEYLAALVQAQLEVAVQAGLDPERAAIAFDVMWSGLSRAATPDVEPAAHRGPSHSKPSSTGAASP